MRRVSVGDAELSEIVTNGTYQSEESGKVFKLTCYPTTEPAFVIRPAPLRRAWMDSFPDHFAYRCLPVNIANIHAWELLCPGNVKARWNGSRHQSDLKVQTDTTTQQFAGSHFGGGILTFQIGYLFRTVPQCNLLITGPMNAPKDGIAPLSGVVETDWAPYSFTMNWMFTRSGAIEFIKDEPFCAFFPIQKGLLDATEPEIRDLDSDAEFQRLYEDWCWSRKEFLQNLAVPDSPEAKMKWQRHYFQGLNPDGTVGCHEHATKLRLKAVVDRRQSRSSRAELRRCETAP